MKPTLTKNTRIVLLVVGLLLYAGLGYFVLVKPQGAKAADARAELAQLQIEITTKRLQSRKVAVVEPIEIADVFRLTKAIPDHTDMPGVLLELTAVARDSGIAFESITPSSLIPMEGYQVVPIELVFEGNFYDLSDFLYRTRRLVGVRDGELDAHGRLFNVESIEFGEGASKFPRIRATVRIEAYVFSAAAPAPVAGAAPGATPTPAPAPATPPTAPAEGATAAGATP